MLQLLKQILYFFTNLKGQLRIRENKAKVTLLGGGHRFDNKSGVNLFCGSTKEDIVLDENIELFGELLSFAHGKIRLGKWVKIGYNSAINCVNSITIDDDTAIADNVIIVDHNFHPINPADRLYMRHTPHGSMERMPMCADNAPIHIGKNVWIGTNVRISKGVTIGDNSVIGANSVVTKNIPANCVAVGNPARIVKENIDTTTTPIFPLKK